MSPYLVNGAFLAFGFTAGVLFTTYLYEKGRVG
jgi:hypothetical protein